MLGYTVDELRALNMSAVYKSASERGALIDQYRRENTQTLTTDVTWQRKDGTPIIVRLTARVAEFEDGLGCFEGVAEDITEKRALEEQLRQALKMEAVGRLARGVAHDFNNVLAAIIGCSDLLALRLKAGDPAKEEAEEIRQAAERGAALTRQLLAFSRSQMLEARLLDLNEVVVHLESMLQRLAGERCAGQRPRVRLPDHVRIEPGQLEQVLMNLVVNARDSMPGGGTIHVLVEPIRPRRDAACCGIRGCRTVRSRGLRSPTPAAGSTRTCSRTSSSRSSRRRDRRRAPAWDCRSSTASQRKPAGPCLSSRPGTKARRSKSCCRSSPACRARRPIAGGLSSRRHFRPSTGRQAALHTNAAAAFGAPAEGCANVNSGPQLPAP